MFVNFVSLLDMDTNIGNVLLISLKEADEAR